MANSSGKNMRVLTKSDVQTLDPGIVNDIVSGRYRFLKAGSWCFKRSVTRAADGKFYAWIEDGRGEILKLKGFKRRKDARAWRDKWVRERRSALNNVRKAAAKRRKPEPTPLEVDKVKADKARRRIMEIDTKVKRLLTLKRKHLRRLKYYEKKTFSGDINVSSRLV